MRMIDSRKVWTVWAVYAIGAAMAWAAAQDAEPPALADQAANTWVKRSPLPTAPVSPQLGYESSMDWDPFSLRLIRHGGHNQGGGGEQNAETWLLDPATMTWEFRQPNTRPPGVCCARDNVFASGSRQLVRFPAFSNSHGWQWPRKIAMRNWSAWAYDAAADTWRNMRPLPDRSHGPGRGAAYDPHHDVIVLFSGQGDRGARTSVYDLYANAWHTMDPPIRPASRCYTGFAYDQVRRRFVLFGAHYSDEPKTWLYDLRDNAWTEAEPPSHPPSNRTAPVMAYDSNHGIMLAVMRSDAKDGRQQTWVYDPAANTWTHMNPEGDLGESGSRNRLLVHIPELNIFVLENRTGNEQQIWTYRYAPVAPAAGPGAPTDVSVRAAADGTAVLTWTPGPGVRPDGYRVLRGSAEVPWKADFVPVGDGLVEDTIFRDSGLPRGLPTYYRVVAVSQGRPDSPDSALVRVQPRALQHATVSVLNAKEVEVAWTPAPEPDVVGYVVERADVEVYSCEQIKGNLSHAEVEGVPSPVGRIKTVWNFERLTPEPIRETRYVDRAVDLTETRRTPPAGTPLSDYSQRADRLDPTGAPYRFAVFAYRVRAVNALGVESGPSPFFLTVPGAVEHVFARETPPDVQLRWAARPEKGIQGYFVYRMDDRSSRRIGRVGPMVEGTTFTDPNVGEGRDNRKRYFVVAVDAIGQEGLVSSPAWANREWHRFYTPFGAGLGTWHQ